MYNYLFNKKCNLEKLTKELSDSNIIVSYMNGTESSTDIYFENQLSVSQETSLQNIVDLHNPVDALQNIKAAVQRAMDFGNGVMTDFIAENVALGITQRGLTAQVREATAKLITCLQTGSLYDAINELKQINPSYLDGVILNSTRLLVFRNKVESCLGITLSTEWNQ